MSWLTALVLIVIGANMPCNTACAARAAEPLPIWPLFLMWPLLMLAIAPWLPFVLWNMVRAWLNPEPLPTLDIPYRVQQGVPVPRLPTRFDIEVQGGSPWGGVLWIDEHGPDGVKRIWERNCSNDPESSKG